MLKVINKIKFWLNCARVYSLPITILSWAVIFVYSLTHGGNPLLGLLALVGIGLVHMATNLIDDYFDYKILSNDPKYINSAQNCKCEYLKTGKATIKELKYTIITFLFVAAIIGAILFCLSGVYVAILALIGLLIALSYQKLSINGLGDAAVIIAYGPLMFEGVFYVMTGNFSLEVLILSIACAFFTNTILYTHMLMDFDGDTCSHKKTLCTKFKTKNNALKFILFFYITSFIMIGILAWLTKNNWYYLTLITLPLIGDLYNSLIKYNLDKNNLPKIYPWHYPLDNWKELRTTPDAPFYFRFFLSRNIVTIFMLITCLAIIFEG